MQEWEDTPPKKQQNSRKCGLECSNHNQDGLDTCTKKAGKNPALRSLCDRKKGPGQGMGSTREVPRSRFSSGRRRLASAVDGTGSMPDEKILFE